MQIFGLFSLLITVAIIGWWFISASPVAPPSTSDQAVEIVLDPAIQAEIDAHADIIILTSPKPNEPVGSPITITGKARGNWFFEGIFPVVVTDWDGKIIAKKAVDAKGPWMTEDFVPFTVTFYYDVPYYEGDPEYMNHGSIILQKNNPSGLPENDDALEIPVIFKAVGAPAPTKKSGTTYNEALDQAHKAANSLEF